MLQKCRSCGEPWCPTTCADAAHRRIKGSLCKWVVELDLGEITNKTEFNKLQRSGSCEEPLIPTSWRDTAYRKRGCLRSQTSTVSDKYHLINILSRFRIRVLLQIRSGIRTYRPTSLFFLNCFTVGLELLIDISRCHCFWAIYGVDTVGWNPSRLFMYLQ